MTMNQTPVSKCHGAVAYPSWAGYPENAKKYFTCTACGQPCDVADVPRTASECIGAYPAQTRTEPSTEELAKFYDALADAADRVSLESGLGRTHRATAARLRSLEARVRVLEAALNEIAAYGCPQHTPSDTACYISMVKIARNALKETT